MGARRGAAGGPKPTAVHCGHLIDTQAGKLLGETTVVVDGRRIRDVIPGRSAPPGAGEIDLSDQTCMPGLIDSHTHLTMEIGPGFYSDKFHWNTADYAVRSTVYARRTCWRVHDGAQSRRIGQRGSVALRNAINAGIFPGRASTRPAGDRLQRGPCRSHQRLPHGPRRGPGPEQGIIDSPEDAVKAVRLHYKPATI